MSCFRDVHDDREFPWQPTPRAGPISGVEVRSIDYVPLNERHGKVWSQGPLWFMSNAQIATLAVGTFVVGGGNLVWSLIAIVAARCSGRSSWRSTARRDRSWASRR